MNAINSIKNGYNNFIQGGQSTPNSNIQAPAAQQTPALRSLKKDTVSFKAGEQQFVKRLIKYCETNYPGNLHEATCLEVLADRADPNNPLVKKTLKEIKENPEIGDVIKRWVFGDLTEGMGKNESITL